MLVRTFYDNKQLKEQYTIIDGEIEGDFVDYHENGKVRSKIQFHNGVLVRTMYCYDESGQLTFRGNYIDGKLNGHSCTYFNGLPYNISYFVNDKKSGKSIFFDNNRNCVAIEVYDNGIKSGPAKFYNTGGNLIKEMQYIDDKIEGRVQYYDQNGKEIFYEIFKNNIKVENIEPEK